MKIDSRVKRTWQTLVLLLPSLWCTPPASGAVDPHPSVTGPIAVSPESGPYRGASEQPLPGPGLPPPDLEAYDYVEEEYFVSGTIEGEPYRTSLLVRKPSRADAFSGLLVVESMHASGGVPLWGSYKNQIMGDGHVSMVIASQKTSVEGFVKASDPVRYAELHLPGPPVTGPRVPGAADPEQELISHRILSQVGALLKGNPTSGPLAGLTVRHAIMGGVSQTGMHTMNYIRTSAGTARMANGELIWDGYYPSMAPASYKLEGHGSKIMHPYGEGDFALLGGMPRTLQSDSDGPENKFRSYEFVGASHVPTRGLSDASSIYPGLPSGSELLSSGKSLSQFPTSDLYNAAFHNFVLWVTRDVPPPSAQPIETVEGEIQRDEFGNALGGVRSPYVDVPSKRYFASSIWDLETPPAPEQGFSMLMLIGLQQDLPAPTLASRYRTQADYLRLFGAGIDRMVSDRFLLSEAGERLKAEEALTPPL